MNDEDLKELADTIGRAKAAICEISLEGLDECDREVVSGLLGYAANYANTAQCYIEFIKSKRSAK